MLTRKCHIRSNTDEDNNICDNKAIISVFHVCKCMNDVIYLTKTKFMVKEIEYLVCVNA